jgi:hypothetical protein
MKKTDHDKIIKALLKEQKRIEEYWRGEVADRQAVIDKYADLLTKMEQEIEEMRSVAL